MSKVELVVGAVLAAVILAVTAWGLHYKGAAQDAELQLAEVKAREKMCFDAVAQLESEAAQREAAAKKALESAQAQADKYALRADALLRRPAAVPGDDCASARVGVRDCLKGRGQ